VGGVAIGVGLSGVAYRLHRQILHITGDCLVMPSEKLHRGRTYTVIYCCQLKTRTIALNELTAAATLQCSQNSVHHASRSVRTTLSHGATQRRLVTSRRRDQESLHSGTVPAQTIEWNRPRMEASFVIQIPKWLPSSGTFGQYPTVQGRVQWLLAVDVSQQHQQHHTVFVLEVGAPKAE